jgi:hypothetical protein
MGEKGNLLDKGEEIFANLAEQGPQFWLSYKQYMDSRGKGDQAARVIVEHQAAAVVEPGAAAQDASTKMRQPSGGKSDQAARVIVEHQAAAVVEPGAAAQDAPAEWWEK